MDSDPRPIGYCWTVVGVIDSGRLVREVWRLIGVVVVVEE